MNLDLNYRKNLFQQTVTDTLSRFLVALLYSWYLYWHQKWWRSEVNNSKLWKIKWPASRKKGPSDISHNVDQDQPLYDVENSSTYSSIPIAYTARNVCAVDVTSVKKCRPWPDAASETRRLVMVYTFCICPKVPKILHDAGHICLQAFWKTTAFWLQSFCNW